MQRIIDWVVKATDLVTMAIMIALFGIMLIGIVFRYILNDSLQWSDEILVWGLVWIIMLGSVGVMAQWRHVYVPVCVLAMPTRWRIPVVILSSRTDEAGIVQALELVDGHRDRGRLRDGTNRQAGERNDQCCELGAHAGVRVAVGRPEFARTRARPLWSGTRHARIYEGLTITA